MAAPLIGEAEEALRLVNLKTLFVADVHGCRQRRDDLSLQCNEKSASTEPNEHASSNSGLRLHSSVSAVLANFQNPQNSAVKMLAWLLIIDA